MYEFRTPIPDDDDSVLDLINQATLDVHSTLQCCRYNDCAADDNDIKFHTFSQDDVEFSVTLPVRIASRDAQVFV
jgi:hypothetical protein